MRTLRKMIYKRDGTRINCVCPGMTDTNMTVDIIDTFRQTKQPINTAEDIAKIILGIETTDGMNGKAVYVEQAQGWEIEDGLWRTMPDWLGEEPTARLKASLAIVDTGEVWKIK